MKKTIKLKCKVCGNYFDKILSIYNADKKKGVDAGKFCSQNCYHKSKESMANLGKYLDKSAGWKGGRLFERGYKLVLANGHPHAVAKGGHNKYIREHRLVMEKHLGRYLMPFEIVHHKNGDKKDNRLENLEIMDSREHSRLHMNNYWKDKCFNKQKGVTNG